MPEQEEPESRLGIVALVLGMAGIIPLAATHPHEIALVIATIVMEIIGLAELVNKVRRYRRTR